MPARFLVGSRSASGVKGERSPSRSARSPRAVQWEQSTLTRPLGKPVIPGVGSCKERSACFPDGVGGGEGSSFLAHRKD